jgi:tRNA 2-selenouridine synthase
MKLVSEDQFEHLLMDGAHFIDVRAPIEFSGGTVPGAVNLPILNDDERRRVGTAYRQQGQAAAITLGHELVSGSVKEARIEAWLAEIQAHPDAILYCFRGGLRSQITQSWLSERGVDRPIVQGGYKAIRRFFLNVLDESTQSLRFEVVSGPTGSGKTHFLKQSGRPFIDLEELAHHRGSAFGALSDAQPTQVNFENALALEFLRLRRTNGPILIEDESRMIGKRVIPERLFQRLQESPRLLLETPFDQRVENIFQDYILNSSLGLAGDVTQFDRFHESVLAISRKLGDLRTKEILRDLQASREDFLNGRRLDSNRIWIEKLLRWYYDPAYRR